MATRNTTKAASLAILAGPSPATGTHSSLTQIHRIQSADYGWEITKEPINQYGQMAPLSREAIDPPTVNLNFSYYITGIDNESALGFYTIGTQSFLKYILDGSQDDRNYFVFVAPEGADANGLTGADGKVKSFGNGFINSYAVEAAVGSFPTASIGILASNMVGHLDGVAEQIPAVNPDTGIRMTGINFTIGTIGPSAGGSHPSVILPGDIIMTMSRATGLFHDVSVGCPQSFSLNVNLNREPLQCLGSKFPRSQELVYPIEATLQVDMLSTDIISGDLSTYRCLTGLYNVDIAFRAPSCTGTGAVSMGISVKNIDLQSQNWSTTYGVLGETMTLNYIGYVGGSGDLNNGVYMSGTSFV